MLSPKNKRKVLQIIPFGIVLLLFNISYILIEKGILGQHPYYPSTGNPYSFNLILPAVMSTVIGLFVGMFEVFYLNKFFQKSSFLKKIIFKTATYLLIITAAILIITISTNAIELGVSIFNKQVWRNAANFFFDFAFWSILLYFALAVIICLFFGEVSDNIGQRVLINFFSGKYHKPIEEERVFMFLDMKNSTKIAEELGHLKYFKMLREYYSDLTDSIIKFDGEIYQYVGDEVVVTWKLKVGKNNNNCLNCFYEMKSSLANQAQKYKLEFGLVPAFKAGIHLGIVTTGEIGVIKKEITFSGDVLNTTARIQGLCNKYEVDLLTSEKLTKAIELGNEFRAQEIEEVELRGRNEKINLFTIEKLIKINLH
jgi:adenylate cyclase